MSKAKLEPGLAGAKFQPGRVVMTPGALELDRELLDNHNSMALFYLFRHLAGDWGDLSDFDKSENDHAVEHDLRILSAYNTPAGKLWIITERDRSATTLLLPSEY